MKQVRATETESSECLGAEMLELLIIRSEDYGLPGVVRTGVRHDMIDVAIRQDRKEVWKVVGEALIRAAEQDDLVPRLSDRFVDSCPDVVFAAFDHFNAACRFAGWRKRTIRLRRK